jgi:8-oxo-dGTP pyrophosphatase MutT (NUDIX family)
VTTVASPSPASIPLAATVVLVRDTGHGPQVLMTKRAAGLSFMAGLWVFPGGRVEGADALPGLVDESTAAATLADIGQRMCNAGGTPLEARQTLGILAAACRETFEESGLLLALRRSDGGAPDAMQVSRLSRARTASVDATSFAAMLRDEALVLDVGRLVYWSHWITPALEGKRFDTRFFAVEAPADQVASVDESELTHHAWLGEVEIRQALESGEMKMAPPTEATLQDLWTTHARHGSVAAMLAGERHRDVPPILPRVCHGPDGKVELVLPWDLGYDSTPGEHWHWSGSYPNHLRALPSRRPARRR